MKELHEEKGVCPCCKKVFYKYRPFQKYCSIECRNKRYKTTKYKYKKKPEKTRKCKNCGEEFTTNDSKIKYCSNQCYLDYQVNFIIKKEPEERLCACCGKPFSTTHHAKRYCSTKCYKEARQRRKREILESVGQ